MFVIEIPGLNINQIYNSKQAPRWIKLKDSLYVIPFKDKALKIEQQISKRDWRTYRLIMSCSEEDFYNIWFKYFDLWIDYVALNAKAKKLLNKKFTKPINAGTGIHVLNQDPFEAYIYGKIASKVGYDKAQRAMNHIAQTCGIKHIQTMGDAGKVTWYEFPTAEMILDNFNNLSKMGKINDWLKRLCVAIVNDDFDVRKSDEALIKLLTSNLDVFPTTEIEETITKNFKCTPDEFSDLYLKDFKDKGVIYFYILHYIKNANEGVKYYGPN